MLADRATLDQYVLLSMLLHVLLIISLGDTSGGARRGERIWGAMNVTLQNLMPDRGSGAESLRMERSLRNLPAAQSEKPPAASSLANKGDSPAEHAAPAAEAAPPTQVTAPAEEKASATMPKLIAKEVTYEVTDLVQGREQLWILNPDGSVAAEPSSLNVLPAPARATLIRQSAGARVVHVFKIPESGSTLYEVASVRENARQVCTVDATGRIVSEDLPLKRLPPLLQKAINAKADGRFIVRIERFPDEKNATCDVTLRRQGKIEIITFGVDGSVQ